MNCFEVRAEFRQGAWRGYFKCAHNAEMRAVQENGQIGAYPSAEKARLAAYEAMMGILNTKITGMRTEARAKAEALFKPVIRGKGRAIPVERKKVRA